MLERIVEEVKNNPGPLTVGELARRLDIEESALSGMLDYLERKGRLSVFRPDECDGSGDMACVACVYGSGCPRASKKEKE
ncbi:MAG: MarR family transcriptional regulator [Actinobacteria bacterium]|nr:MarR family transcriptional regulator [Actinomycetota bacterium]MBU1943824.1 MarR family transcriptional regulator [Actinomycetota bacterium]MBU2689015.1 MarR family transcriptional regulator [Actinomycetota bacterium]